MKYILNIVAVLAVVLIVVGVIRFRDSESYYSARGGFSRVTDFIGSFFQARKQAVQAEISPSRRRPLSMIEAETYLQQVGPDIFDKFSQQDWQRFWKYIYEPIEDRSGQFVTKRQRTTEEIESHLKYRYPNPFTYFGREHWAYFWRLIEGRSG